MDSDFRKSRLGSLITKHLGYRSPVAYYSYSDILKNLFYLHAMGGEELDDLNILRDQLKDRPNLSVCSADTVE